MAVKPKKERKAKLEAIKIEKKEVKKEEEKKKEAKFIENPFQEKDKFAGSSVIDIPAPSLKTPASPLTSTQSQRLEEITSETATETLKPEEAPIKGYAARPSQYAGNRERGARNQPQYSGARTSQDFRTVEAATASSSSFSPTPLRALQRAQFQDPSVRGWESNNNNAEDYALRQPKFAEQNLNDPHVQSASRGKKEVDMREYEI